MRVNNIAQLLTLFLTILIFGLSIKSYANSDCGDYACQQALVKFSKKASQDEIEATFKRLKITPLQYFENSRLYHVELEGGQNTLTEIEELKNQKKVLVAAPNSKITLDTLPNDNYFSYQWALKNNSTSVSFADLGLEDIWDYYTDASSTIIAVIDTGVDYNHPDLVANMWENENEIAGNGIDDDANGYVDDVLGYDFANDDADPMDDHYHGTHVAGTIAAEGNNGIGVSGVAWHAKIMPLKFLNSSGSGWFSDGVAAIEYAINNGAKILNNSWGSYFNDPTLESVVAATESAGAIFVAAAGNDAEDCDLFPHYPSSYSGSNVVAVASMNQYDELSSFSNYGLISVDIAAPGESILSTIPTRYYTGDEDYAYLSGTSMASPQVAGALALLWSAFPDKSYLQIIDLLYQGGISKDYLQDKVLTGKIPNVSQSLFLGNNSLNHAPLANAGSNQLKSIQDQVTLYGQVSDEDVNAVLSYQWTLNTPAGSLSELNDSQILQPSFVPDTVGVYTATLIAYDGIDHSSPSSMQVDVRELDVLPPVVVISLFKEDSGVSHSVADDSQVELGKTITLDASSTSDNQNEDLDYEWSVVSKPLYSQAEIENANQSIATLIPDKTGTYHLMLTVDDGRNEARGMVTVVVTEASVSAQGDGKQSGDYESASSSGGCSLNVLQQKNRGNDFDLFGLSFYSLAFLTVLTLRLKKG